MLVPCLLKTLKPRSYCASHFCSFQVKTLLKPSSSFNGHHLIIKLSSLNLSEVPCVNVGHLNVIEDVCLDQVAEESPIQNVVPEN